MRHGDVSDCRRLPARPTDEVDVWTEHARRPAGGPFLFIAVFVLFQKTYTVLWSARLQNLRDEQAVATKNGGKLGLYPIVLSKLWRSVLAVGVLSGEPPSLSVCNSFRELVEKGYSLARRDWHLRDQSLGAMPSADRNFFFFFHGMLFTPRPGLYGGFSVSFTYLPVVTCS